VQVADFQGVEFILADMAMKIEAARLMVYTAASARTGDAWAADIIVKVAPPNAREVGRLHGARHWSGSSRRVTPTLRSPH